jgi:hypothetical protein
LVLAEAWQDCVAEDRAGELAALGDIIANEAHPKQRAFVLDDSKSVCAVVGRGGGKTTGAMFRFVRLMLKTPHAACLFIATTREQAEKLLWVPLKALCEKYGIAARFYEDSLTCVFRHNSATLCLAGADNKKSIEKYRGIPHHEVWIDECGSYPPRLLKNLKESIIEPRLGDFDGTLGLIGTPGHIHLGPFYELTRPGSDMSRRWDERDDPAFANWDSWSFHDWTLVDALESGAKVFKSLWAAALVRKRNNGWSDDNPVWNREYLGKWAADDTERVYRYRPHDDEGKPWNQWDPERHPSGLAKLPKAFTDWCFVYGMDFGTKDPFALEVFAYSPTDPAHNLWHVYEFTKRGEMYARNVVRLLVGDELDVEHPAGIVGQTDWPEGMAGDGSAQTLLDELLNVYGIKVEAAPRKQGDKLDSIELFNGDLQDGRIHILKGSELETQLSELQWVLGENGELKEDKAARNDCTDAAIYARRIARHLVLVEEPSEAPYFPDRRVDPTQTPWDQPKKDEYASLFGDDDNLTEFDEY